MSEREKFAELVACNIRDDAAMIGWDAGWQARGEHDRILLETYRKNNETLTARIEEVCKEKLGRLTKTLGGEELSRRVGDSFAKGKQAGRDEVMREMSEMEPVAVVNDMKYGQIEWWPHRTKTVGSFSSQGLYIKVGTELIPRPTYKKEGEDAGTKGD